MVEVWITRLSPDVELLFYVEPKQFSIRVYYDADGVRAYQERALVGNSVAFLMDGLNLGLTYINENKRP